jgi:hypothetical protein
MLPVLAATEGASHQTAIGAGVGVSDEGMGGDITLAKSVSNVCIGAGAGVSDDRMGGDRTRGRGSGLIRYPTVRLLSPCPV